MPRSWRDPLRKFDSQSQVAPEIALVDGFMVSCAVPDEVELLHPEGYVTLPGAEIWMRMRERRVRRRHPQ